MKKFSFVLLALFICFGLWQAHTDKTSLHTSPPHKDATPLNDTLIHATGYGGPIQLSVNINNKHHITHIKILSHNETPSYIKNIEHFLQQFISKGPDNAFNFGEDIDGITSATITSQGMTQAIKKHMNSLKSRPLPATSTSQNIPLHYIFIPLSLLLLALTALVKKLSWLRWITMTLSCLYFGFFTHTMLSITQIANIGLGNIPTFNTNPLWFILLGIAFIPALFIGRIYCGALCPFAFIQEILNGLRFQRHRTKTSPHATAIKYILAITTLGLCLWIGTANPSNIEPFITLFTQHNTRLAWIFLGLMLLLGIFYFRFWCTYLCPVGALTGLASQFSLFKLIAPETCRQCNSCEKICPVNAIHTKPSVTIDATECILCGQCLKHCPDIHIGIFKS